MRGEVKCVRTTWQKQYAINCRLHEVPTPIKCVAGMVQIIKYIADSTTAWKNYSELRSDMGAICAPEKSKSHYKLLPIN